MQADQAAARDAYQRHVAAGHDILVVSRPRRNSHGAAPAGPDEELTLHFCNGAMLLASAARQLDLPAPDCVPGADSASVQTSSSGSGDGSSASSGSGSGDGGSSSDADCSATAGAGAGAQAGTAAQVAMSTLLRSSTAKAGKAVFPEGEARAFFERCFIKYASSSTTSYIWYVKAIDASTGRQLYNSMAFSYVKKLDAYVLQPRSTGMGYVRT